MRLLQVGQRLVTTAQANNGTIGAAPSSLDKKKTALGRVRMKRKRCIEEAAGEHLRLCLGGGGREKRISPDARVQIRCEPGVEVGVSFGGR